MKKGKFVSVIVILLVFFAVVFFIGWTQFRVKVGYVGVVMSKTGGIDERAVKPGHFSYHAEFLLPTNAKLKLFNLKPRVFSPLISGQNEENAEYTYEAEITIALKEEKLTRFLKENSIFDEESLDLYAKNYAEEIAGNVARKLMKNSKEKISLSSLTTSELKKIAEINEEDAFRVISFKTKKAEILQAKKANAEPQPEISEEKKLPQKEEKQEKIESATQKSI